MKTYREMKVEELRIGNYFNTLDGDFKLIHIDTFRKRAYSKNRIYNLDVIQPTPLTEEWLIKFGFTKMLNQFKKKGNPPFVILKLDGVFEYDDLRFRTNIKHVHQLQNLYFALTGEELIFKI